MFPLLKEMKVDGILMEYEDMFPYWNELSVLRRAISYDGAIIKAILEVNFFCDKFYSHKSHHIHSTILTFFNDPLENIIIIL